MTGDTTTWAWDERLRAHGYRITPQRHLVLRAVDELGHATPEEIHSRVTSQAAGVNLSTVYRTLEVLEEVGLISHAHIAHGSPTYHSARDSVHVHLVCRHCDGVESVPADAIAPLVQALDSDRGFRADLGHLTVHGVCASCRDTSGASDPRHGVAPATGSGRGREH